MAAARWTPNDDTRLRELAATGTPIRQIATQLGRSRSAVDRRLHTLHTGIDRSQTAAATVAASLDAKARRAALEVALLEDAERLRAQLFAPTVAFNFGGRDNTYAEHELPQPAHADQLKLMQAVGAAVDRSLKIAEHDGDQGLPEAVGMLDQIAAAIKTAAGQDQP